MTSRVTTSPFSRNFRALRDAISSHAVTWRILAAYQPRVKIPIEKEMQTHVHTYAQLRDTNLERMHFAR